VAPVDPAKVQVGDLVLARVAGTVYLHCWTSHVRVFGVCTAVDGDPRPRLDGKVRTAQMTWPGAPEY
jgi:hypothetical protein